MQAGGGEQLIVETQSTSAELFEPFTESQQADLDRLFTSSQPAPAPLEPRHLSNLPSNFDIEENLSMLYAPKSLMQLFRPAGRLSVTDLVLPIW